MTNDTSTLSGALLEMKDQLIYELGEKGVTAQYDSTTGLLGLIGRISDIQTGGSCYHIEFSEDSYTAVGGSATLEIMLQSNYQPLSGATVTVTGSDSSLYTGITNTDGIASINVNVSAQTTFTCSYSNVTDTCIVTTSIVIYQPALDGTETKKQITGTTTIANGVMTCGASYLTPGWDNTINWKLTFEAKITNDQSAVAIYNPNDTQRDKNQIKITGNYHKNITSYTNGSAESSKTTSVPVGTWFAIECVKNGNSLTATWNNNSYTITWTQLTTLSKVCIGVDTWGNCSSIRNIKVEAL